MATDTPETDKAERMAYAGEYMAPTELARKLERERDEEREQVKDLIYIADRAIDLAERYFENDKFGVVSRLRYGLQKIKEETK